MTERRDDDLTTTPFESDDERAEHEWLLARERDPNTPPPSLESAARYAHLENLLCNLPSVAGDDRWQAEVLKRATADAATPSRLPRSVKRWLAAGGGIVAAAAVVLLLLRPRPIGWEIKHGGEVRSVASSDGQLSANVGDHLRISLPQASEVRVYAPDGKLAAKCPGGPECVAGPDGSHVDLTFKSADTYTAVLVVDGGDLSEAKTLADFLDRARNAGKQIITKTIEIQ
jgi:hypothetical protein